MRDIRNISTFFSLQIYHSGRKGDTKMWGYLLSIMRFHQEDDGNLDEDNQDGVKW